MPDQPSSASAASDRRPAGDAAAPDSPRPALGPPGSDWPLAVILFAALALGAAHALSFSMGPASLLQWLSMAALFALWRWGAIGVPLRWRIALGAAFGLGWFATGLSWLYISMHDYGGMPAPIAAAAVVLFAAYLAIFPTAALLAFGDGLAGARPVRAALALAGAWTIGEWLRGTLFTGFPWLAVGYAHLDDDLVGLAPVLGVYGVGGVAVLQAALLAILAFDITGTSGRAARASRIGAVALLIGTNAAGFALGWVDWSRPHGEPIQVRLVQGNVPQSMKFDPATSARAMAMYADRVLAAKADLTVLPETAWTVPWQATPPEIARRLTTQGGNAHPVAIGVPAFTGAAGPGGYPQLANSVILLQPGQDPDRAPRYDKRHLVPFGEFVPPMFAWFVSLMNIPLGSFGRGGDAQPAFEVAGQRLGFDICYEDLFGEELLPQVREPVGATILVNVSNLGWFGRSHALPQHLAIARMRAIENARPMLRATNTGVTASIDARGRVRLALEPFTVGTLEDRVQGTTGLTPYARTGNVVTLALALIAIVAGAWRTRNR